MIDFWQARAPKIPSHFSPQRRGSASFSFALPLVPVPAVASLHVSLLLPAIRLSTHCTVYTPTHCRARALFLPLHHDGQAIISSTAPPSSTPDVDQALSLHPSVHPSHIGRDFLSAPFQTIASRNTTQQQKSARSLTLQSPVTATTLAYRSAFDFGSQRSLPFPSTPDPLTTDTIPTTTGIPHL